MDLDDDKVRRIAFHEAGHAWMMVREGLGVRSVSIKHQLRARGDNRGEAVPEMSLEEGRRELSERFARACLAGSAAEHYLLGRWDEESLQASAFDTGRAKSCLVLSGDDWKPEALDFYVRSLADRVMEEISRPRAWHTITGLAYALMEKGAMGGEEAERLLGEGTL